MWTNSYYTLRKRDPGRKNDQKTISEFDPKKKRESERKEEKRKTEPKKEKEKKREEPKEIYLYLLR